MAEKIALQGFSRVKFFPIKKNDSTGYEVGEGIDIPWAQTMTRDADTSESTIYGDDTIYAKISNWNGISSTITVIEMPLATMALLGFGEFDEEKNELKWDPQGKSLEFAVTFRCLQNGGTYRMYKMYRFSVEGIEESETSTKGDSADVQPYNIIGTFTNRLYDDTPGAIHDGTDTEWLDTIEPAGASTLPGDTKSKSAAKAM